MEQETIFYFMEILSNIHINKTTIRNKNKLRIMNKVQLFLKQILNY